ncbi:hypothetical protein FRC00_004589, partial [Tulasnella sp. 408]
MATESEELSAPVDLSTIEFETNVPTWSGGAADVFKATHPQLGALALKRPRGACHPGSSGYKQIEKEAAIWKDLIHPNVLRFIALYEREGAFYIVSPFLHNGTVPEYLSKNPNANRASLYMVTSKGTTYSYLRHEDRLRPSMDNILESLESHNKLGKIYLKARIKVICEQMPHLTGYVSRTLDDRSGSQVVTREVSKSLIITWDPKASGSQVVYMV